MTVEVGGAGTVGLAVEAVLGTYIAPTKWVPIRSESLSFVNDLIYRHNIRGVADRQGVIPGYSHVEGDIVFEPTADTLPYFFYAARVTPVKSAGPPYTYTFTPAHVAKASTAAGATNRKTLSLLIQRGGNPMAYVGCSVGQLAFTIEDGVLICTATIIGVDESAQSAGTPAWPTTAPWGPGKLSLELPTATPRADVSTFSLTINDNLVTANRLNGQRKAAYQNWGEREVSMSFEADFDTLTDFNIFVAGTSQSASFKAIGTVGSDEFSVVMAASFIDAYTANLSALGDVVGTSAGLHGVYGTTDSYVAVVKTAENIT
jgi:hypothetical protein